MRKIGCSLRCRGFSSPLGTWCEHSLFNSSSCSAAGISEVPPLCPEGQHPGPLHACQPSPCADTRLWLR